MNKVDNCADRDDPDAAKETPEIVVDCKRILHPEDEAVACQGDAVVEEETLSFQGILLRRIVTSIKNSECMLVK